MSTTGTIFSGSGDAYDRFMGRYSTQLAPAFADFAGVAAGMRVLDVGAGTGALTQELVARLGEANVAAAEPSPDYAAVLRERFPGVEIQQAPAADLPWEDGAFDAALAQLVVVFVDDAPAAFRELARVTKSGGVVATTMWEVEGMDMMNALNEMRRELRPGRLARGRSTATRRRCVSSSSSAGCRTSRRRRSRSPSSTRRWTSCGSRRSASAARAGLRSTRSRRRSSRGAGDLRGGARPAGGDVPPLRALRRGARDEGLTRRCGIPTPRTTTSWAASRRGSRPSSPTSRESQPASVSSTSARGRGCSRRSSCAAARWRPRSSRRRRSPSRCAGASPTSTSARARPSTCRGTTARSTSRSRSSSSRSWTTRPPASPRCAASRTAASPCACGISRGRSFSAP